MGTSVNEPEETGEIRNPDGTFAKGVSGNPDGRPKGSLSVVEAIRRELDKVADLPSNKEKKTYLELLIQRIMKKAIGDGDVAMIRDMINRIDGMPKQPVEMSGSIDTRLEVLTKMGLNDTKTERIEESTSEDSRN